MRAVAVCGVLRHILDRMWQADRPRIGAVMFVFRPDAKFLMFHRTKGCGQGQWSVPGGKVEHGETVRETAIREVKEETGLRVQGARIIAVTEEAPCSCGEHWLTFWLKSEGPVQGEPVLNEEGDQFRWVRWGDWPQPLWQPYWDDLFTALNSEQRIGMTGGMAHD